MKTFDIEILKNYSLFAFMDDKGKTTKIEMRGKHTHLTSKQALKLRRLLASDTIVTFNGIKYDYVITAHALVGYSCFELYSVSQMIIKENVPYWRLYKNNVKELSWSDHIDLIEPAPDVMVSLKLYGARLFSQKLWEVDVDWDKKLSKSKMDEVSEYCTNDLILTWDLYRKIEPSIHLRERMSKQYGIDLRSKSDAQIAETVILSELGFSVGKPEIPKSIRYEPPKFIKFKSPELKKVLKRFKEHTFDINPANGKPINPDWLKGTIVRLGEAQFQLGLGGLHSTEASLTVISDKKNVMRNADVASFYPRIIINSNLFPPQLTKLFLNIYADIVDSRLVAKANIPTYKKRIISATGKELAKLKLKLIDVIGETETKKIAINGSFGKFGSKYSKLYAPTMLLATTITGQLSLLMLIEALESNGIPVVSANTDGVEYFCPRDKVLKAYRIVKRWEKMTGYTMENDEYVSLHARDVNNYVAKYKNYVKSKGAYKCMDDMPILKKNPQTPICFTAVRDFIEFGTPIKKTIKNCKDIAQFTASRKVTGGASWRGDKVGGIVRWYYSINGEPMLYIKPNATGNHNKVPLTDGCVPMMDLTKRIPKDLDYNWYIEYAIQQYNLLGGKSYESIQATKKKAKK